MTSATINISAIDSSGRTLGYATQNISVAAPVVENDLVNTSGPYSIQLGPTQLAVGGQADMELIYNGIYASPIPTLSFTSTNDSVMQVISFNLNDSTGYGTVLVKGISLGSANIIGTDSAGSVGQSGDFSTSTIYVSAGVNPQVVEGQTYSADNTPGFTFTTATSLTPIVVNFTTAGSTLPNNLMGNLSSGTVTIPAGSGSVFLPFTVPDDGKIAPTRTAVVTVIVAGETQPSTALMPVQNNDVPSITVNGLQFWSKVPLDTQQDPKLFAVVNLNAPTDGTVTSETFSWDPNQDIIWKTKAGGKVGTDDLASAAGVIKDTNGDHYTWSGNPPSQLWLQAIANSDTQGFDPPVTYTSVGLAVKVSKPATPLVAAESRTSSNAADFLQLGPTLSVAQFVNLNGNDDNGSTIDSGIPQTRDFQAGQEPNGDGDLVQATVSLPSFVTSGTITLSVLDPGRGKITLWTSAQKSAKANLFTITATHNYFTFYVEGVFPSGKINDVTIVATMAADGVTVVAYSPITVTPVLTNFTVTKVAGAKPGLTTDLWIDSSASTPGKVPVIFEADAIEGSHPNGTLKFFVDVKNINKLAGGVGATITLPNGNVPTRTFDFQKAADGTPIAPGSTLVDGGEGTSYFVSNQTTVAAQSPSEVTKTTASDNPRLQVGGGNGVVVPGDTTIVDVEYSYIVYAVWDFGGTGNNDVFAVLAKTTYNVEFNESIAPQQTGNFVNNNAVALANDAINPSTGFDLLDPTEKPIAYKPPYANEAASGWKK